MKPTFKIKDQTYEFKEIDLQSYYKLQDILKEEKKGSEYEIVSIVTGCPADLLSKVKYGDWIIIWEETQRTILAMNGSAFDVLPVIEHKGIQYALPAIEDITVGEFADLDVITTSDNAERRLAEIAAIVYREVTKKRGTYYVIKEYDEEGFKERVEAFQDLPVSAIRSANSFFLQCANLSLKNTVDYLLNSPEMKMLDQKGQEALRKLLQPEVGGDYSISSVEKTLSDFRSLHNSRLEKRSTGWLGKKTKQLASILKGKKKHSID
jgi:hypothetical protein